MSETAIKSKSVRIITEEEERKLLTACTGKYERFRPLLICSLDAGLRRSELQGLRWRDVDLDARVITLSASATKMLRARRAVMTGRMVNELREQREVATDDLVFDFPMSFNRLWSEVVSVVGLPGLLFWDARHTFAERNHQARHRAI